MGVYIKGMEMPKNCEKCLYLSWSNFYQIYVCNAVRKNEPVLFDGKQTKSTSCARSARADNCPLVPVPPHGRLIDADKLRKAIRPITEEDDFNACTFKTVKELMKNHIDDAPTIIPASEEI